MTYPGGKGSEGVYQTLINQIPRFRMYVEPFAGGATIARRLGYHAHTILIERNPVQADILRRDFPYVQTGDGFEYLPTVLHAPETFLFVDPPYLPETRVARHMYGDCELSRADHERLLGMLQGAKAMVMLTGYPAPLYDEALQGWRTIDYTNMTRGGPRTERAWMNYPEPSELACYEYLGRDRREREKLRRRRQNLLRKLAELPPLERAHLLAGVQP